MFIFFYIQLPSGNVLCVCHCRLMWFQVAWGEGVTNVGRKVILPVSARRQVQMVS